MTSFSGCLLSISAHQAPAIRTCLAIAQANPASSRAIAVVTTVGDFRPGELAIAPAQPLLGFPRGVADGFARPS